MAVYVEHKTLIGEHCDSVNSLAFLQNGKYLASASSDCSVCIWKVSSGAFLFCIVFESAVNTLLWHPTRQDNLLCGCEDGSVLSMRDFTPVRSIVLSEVDIRLMLCHRKDTMDSIFALVSRRPSLA